MNFLIGWSSNMFGQKTSHVTKLGTSTHCLTTNLSSPPIHLPPYNCAGNHNYPSFYFPLLFSSYLYHLEKFLLLFHSEIIISSILLYLQKILWQSAGKSDPTAISHPHLERIEDKVVLASILQSQQTSYHPSWKFETIARSFTLLSTYIFLRFHTYFHKISFRLTKVKLISLSKLHWKAFSKKLSQLTEYWLFEKYKIKHSVTKDILRLRHRRSRRIKLITA